MAQSKSAEETEFAEALAYVSGRLFQKLKEEDKALLGSLCTKIKQLIGKLEQRKQETGKAYDLEADLWRDPEVPDWEEIIISVRAEFDDYEGKRRLWEDIEPLYQDIAGRRRPRITLQRLKPEHDSLASGYAP